MRLRRKVTGIGLSLLLSLSILLGCASTKKVEQIRMEAEPAMQAAQEAAKKAETLQRWWGKE